MRALPQNSMNISHTHFCMQSLALSSVHSWISFCIVCVCVCVRVCVTQSVCVLKIWFVAHYLIAVQKCVSCSMHALSYLVFILQKCILDSFTTSE